MYRVNLVLMVILSLAVVGSAVFLAVSADNPEDQEKLHQERLLHKLADNDPDISREAREEILAMGPKALPMLRDAASSRDETLAERADDLLAKMTGGKPNKHIADAVVEKTPEKNEEPQDVERIVKIHLQATQTEIGQGEAPSIYVRLINGLDTDVQIAHQLINGLPSFARFGYFEITDPAGETYQVRPELWSKDADLSKAAIEFTVVASGDSHNLYRNQPDGATTLGAPFENAGVYTIKFVYDAGSDYQQAVASSGLPAMPLTAQKFESNEIEITVVAAR